MQDGQAHEQYPGHDLVAVDQWYQHHAEYQRKQVHSCRIDFVTLPGEYFGQVSIQVVPNRGRIEPVSWLPSFADTSARNDGYESMHRWLRYKSNRYKQRTCNIVAECLVLRKRCARTRSSHANYHAKRDQRCRSVGVGLR